MTESIIKWTALHTDCDLTDFTHRLINRIGGLNSINDCLPFIIGLTAYSVATRIVTNEELFEYLVCTNWLASPVDNSLFTSTIVDAYYDDTPKAGYSNDAEISTIYKALQAYFSEGAVL